MSEEGQFSAPGGLEPDDWQNGGRYPIPVEEEQERLQERFNQFIRAENERLNRLIRNLYLYLQFKHYSERDLYDRICQEVAEYFRAASCELFVVRYEEEYEPQRRSGGLAYYAGNARDGALSLTKWLELVGAFGPARRALRQQYVTRRSRSRYEIPMVGPVEPDEVSSWTRQAFLREAPTRYASTIDFRSIRAGQSSQGLSKWRELRRDSPRQVIWYQDRLYNSCRCSLAAPLVREGKTAINGHRTPYHSRVGLIKLENRSPYAVAGFSDVPDATANPNHLFFAEEWQIVALRPYLRDLREAVKKGHDPFLPVHNNVGWQQYFEDHPVGGHYFRQLIRKLRQQRKSQDFQKFAQKLPDQYENLTDWLEKLLECLIRLEEWLQHLRHACHLMCGLDERPTLDRPTPSLFNIYNLRAAYSTQLFEIASVSSAAADGPEEPATQSKRYTYDAVCKALLDCLARHSPDPEHSKNQLTTLESVLSAIERFRYSLDELDQGLERDALPLFEADALIRNVAYCQREIKARLEDLQKLLDPVKSKSLKRLNEDFQILNISNIQLQSAGLYQALKRTRASVEPIQAFAEQEAEDTIDGLCRLRADAMKKTLRGPTSAHLDFEKSLIEQALGEEGLPELELEAALEEGVLADLSAICETMEDTELTEREFEYELTREEDDVRRITKVVQGILKENRELEDRYGVACQLLELGDETHNAVDSTICKTARALAAATLYAGAFNQIDETRLVYIASHIVKVLDNHMLHQALQRELELDYDALDVLGLEHFGLELLEILHSYAQRTASALYYLHQRETYRSREEAPLLSTHLPRLKKLVDAIAQCSNGDGEPDENEWLNCHLATVTAPSSGTSECILKQIYGRGTRLGLEVVLSETSDGHPSRITFRPAEGRGPGGKQWLAKSVLWLKGKDRGQADGTCEVELLICFNRAALCDRNLRALWSGVNVLEDTWKVVEATTGRTICYS